MTHETAGKVRWEQAVFAAAATFIMDGLFLPDSESFILITRRWLRAAAQYKVGNETFFWLTAKRPTAVWTENGKAQPATT